MENKNNIAGVDILGQVTDGDSYCIIPSNSLKVFDIINYSSSNGAGLQQFDYYGTINQQFKFQSAGNDFCYIVSTNSGKVLDVTGGEAATANGIKIQQWDNLGATNQQFKLEFINDIYYKIVARNSGKVLDVTGGPSSTGNGARIQQWDFIGGYNQQFRIQRSSSVPIMPRPLPPNHPEPFPPVLLPNPPAQPFPQILGTASTTNCTPQGKLVDDFPVVKITKDTIYISNTATGTGNSLGSWIKGAGGTFNFYQTPQDGEKAYHVPPGQYQFGVFANLTYFIDQFGIQHCGNVTSKMRE